MNRSISEWVSDEFETSSFGDERLNQRFKKILEGCLSRSESTVSSVFDSWSEIKGAYRFLDNEKVSYENILSPHYFKTASRVKAKKTVLLIQDTVYLDFKHREKTTGLDVVWKRGESSSKPTRGIILHNLIAVSTEGLPLGILRQKFVERRILKDQYS